MKAKFDTIFLEEANRLPAKVFDVVKQHLSGYKQGKFFNRSDAMLSKFFLFSLENSPFSNNRTLSQEV